jgi:hypothetical protein
MLHVPTRLTLRHARGRPSLRTHPVRSNWRAFQGQFGQHCGKSGLLAKASPLHPGPTAATNWFVANVDPHAQTPSTPSRVAWKRGVGRPGSTAVIIR